MKIEAIIPAGGKGSRMEEKIPKPLIEINGKPIIIHTLCAFQENELIDNVILVVSEDYMDQYEKNIKKYNIKKIKKIIPGGKMRHDSVDNGIKEIDADTDIVLIHDGVRPLITKQIIDDSISLCESHDAVVVAVPVKPTIKIIDTEKNIIQSTLDRKKIWEIQTPQVFKTKIIKDAYNKAQKNNFIPTDDASLVEHLGIDIKVLMGDYKNIKITTKEDLVIAEAFLN